MSDKIKLECKTCVLTESSVIHIESNGNCNVCNSKDLIKQIIRPPDPQKLIVIVDEIKKRGQYSKFDCIVGWSGGRDSTALLYELVRTHNLRCLAVFYKTPFTPKEIIENVRSIANKLNIDLIESETPRSHLKIAAFCIKLYAKTKLPILINLACAPCKYVNRDIFRIAARNRIRSVIYGGNQYEYIPSSPAAIDIHTENRYSFFSMLRDNLLRIKKGIAFISSSPQLYKYLFIFFKASVLYVNPYTIYLRLRHPNIYRFDYYLVADWDENRIHSILQELGWKLPSGCNSTWRADCAFEAVKNTVFKESIGFTYAHAMYSNLIRAGKISRLEAKRRLEKERVSEERLNEVLRMCGLPEGYCFLNNDDTGNN